MFESLIRPKPEPPPDVARIESLIAALCGGKKEECLRARRALVVVGPPAVEHLTALLASSDHHVRWEAAKVLSRIGDPAAAPELVKTLEDPSSDIRWLAARGLIAAGREALPALLQALVQRSHSVRLREGARHVLRALVRRSPDDPVAPVLAALEDIEPALEVPVAASTAFHKLG